MPLAPPTTDVALSSRGLVKRYGDLVAVDGIDLDVRSGTCLAVLGPNGAGKTTTIEMLEGLKRPDGGEIEVLGMRWSTDGDAIRSAIGVQLQETEFQDKLTSFETLRLFRSFFAEASEPAEILELVGLTEKRDVHVVKLSGGQRQRLAVGCALLSRPRILFLDEPTTGLDPQARRRLWTIVEDFKSRGGTCVLTTHYMEEAERLADDLVIVDSGKVIARGSPADVIASLQAESFVDFVPAEPDGLTEADLQALRGVASVRFDGAAVSLSVTDTQAAIHALFALLEERGVEVDDLRTHRPTLEDVFVSLTGKHLRDE